MTSSTTYQSPNHFDGWKWHDRTKTWLSYCTELSDASCGCSLILHCGCTLAIMGHCNCHHAGMRCSIYFNSSPRDKMAAISQTTFSNVFLRMIFFCIFIKISLMFVPKGPIENNPTLVQIMACCLYGAKADLIYWRICAALGGDVLIVKLVAHTMIRTTVFCQLQHLLAGTLLHSTLNNVAILIDRILMNTQNCGGAFIQSTCVLALQQDRGSKILWIK